MPGSSFTDTTPTLENYWRAIILFGRNVASYKFALAKSLLELDKQSGELLRLAELAEPFSRHVCEHLRNESKQSTSSSSRFLDTCDRFNRGEIPKDELVDATVRLGFNNVLDAFHNVNQQEIPIRFFADERSAGGIRLTDNFFTLLSTNEARDLPEEVEARWRLVETAWALNISRNVIAIDYDSEAGLLFPRSAGRRKSITSCRAALNGYQKGKCFYCSGPISVLPGDDELADVDHFFPHVLAGLHESFAPVVNGVWNLVLACADCNRGKDGKSARIPVLSLLDRLHVRNEYLISSHHPLRETIIAQTGIAERQRRDFLQTKYTVARSINIHTWQPRHQFQAVL
jgi:5-methylcytosine-specific restriction endonuclease McrA